jgi:two-component system chemotaxis response regulator CheB
VPACCLGFLLLVPDISAPFTVLLGNLPTTGRLALKRLLEQQPRLCVVEALSRQMIVPVLLYCEAAPLTGMLREASRWGVTDFISANTSASEWGREVLRKVWAAFPLPTSPLEVVSRVGTVPGLPGGVVVIGGSTGGTTAVESLVRALPATLACAVIVAVHLPASFLDSFVKRLARASALPVVAGWAGTLLEPGRIVVAPGGRNVLVRRATNSPWQCWQLDIATEASPSGDEPSIDILMRSVARTVGPNVLGVVLTGMGRDGTLGAQAIRQHGGTVLVQDKTSSVVFSMPNSVIQAGWANAVLPLADLPNAITLHAGQFRRVVAEARNKVSSVPQAV